MSIATRAFHGVLPAKQRRFRKKRVTIKKLSRRVSKLEEARDFDVSQTDTDDSDIFTTPFVKQILVSNTSTTVLLNWISMQGIIEQRVDSVDTELTRIVIVRMHSNADPDNDTPTWLEVFNENEVFSQRKIDATSGIYDPNFTIVYDRVFSTHREAGANTKSKLYFSFMKRYKGLKVLDSVPNAHTNAFYMMMTSTAATGEIDVSTSFRVMFEDIEK